MRARLSLVVGFLALVAGCGFGPKPKNGALPCDEGCPGGYVCGADNHCWVAGTQMPDGASDGVPIAKDSPALDTGVDLGSALTSEAGSDVATDGPSSVDVAGKQDGGIVDGAGSADAVASSIDAPMGTGGTGGSGDAGGVDRNGTGGAAGDVGGAAGGVGGVGGGSGSGGI